MNKINYWEMENNPCNEVPLGNWQENQGIPGHLMFGRGSWRHKEGWTNPKFELPRETVVNGQRHVSPVLVTTRKGRVRKAYYFPDRFKKIEFEDWDDYSEEQFPWTEEDIFSGEVWLRAGWYEDVECERCEGYWSSPLDVIAWQYLPERFEPKEDDNI